MLGHYLHVAHVNSIVFQYNSTHLWPFVWLNAYCALFEQLLDIDRWNEVSKNSVSLLMDRGGG